MGEEVPMSDYEGDVRGGDEEQRVMEWEVGLPNADDLTPLSQLLIPSELASAFSLSPEPSRSVRDVNRASQNTLSNIRGQIQAFSSNNLKSFPSSGDERGLDPLVVEGDENDPGSPTKDGSDARKLRRVESSEEADSALRIENSGDDPSASTLKRPRLVWTPQLHKRFVDVVGHLGIKNAVPKTIMQLMNVEGLTRENVASHLQKYRLYLKRMQGLSIEDPPTSDQLVASTPVLESNESGGHAHMSFPMPYAAPLMPMPFLGVAHGHGHMAMPISNHAAAAYHGFESHPYGMFRDQQQDWSGNRFGSVVSYPHDN